MNDEKDKMGPRPTMGKGCAGMEKPGKSQKMAEDETTANDVAGASHYERVESDQSKGIFAQQTKTYNRVMDGMLNKDGENARNNLADYAEEQQEESEAGGGQPKPYGETEGSPDFPSDGKFTPPY